MIVPESASILKAPLRPSCLTDYRHASRSVLWQTEQFECTPDEQAMIDFLPRGATTFGDSPTLPGPYRVIIDTDIGSDVDDAITLLYALRTPDIEIVGITTNYGATPIRTEIARRIIASHRRVHATCPDIPVVTGSSRPMGTHRLFLVTGFEGFPLVADEFRQANSFEQTNSLEQYEAADFIARKVDECPGEITIVSIGMPTNLALALQRHPEIVDKFREVVVMGGRYQDNPMDDALDGKPVRLLPSHNLAGDTVASQILFTRLKCPIRLVTSAAARHFLIKGPAIDHLRAADRESASGIVGTLMDVWFTVTKANTQQLIPYDPLTLHEARYTGPDGCLKYIRGTFVVHEWAAFLTFVPHPQGNHYFGHPKGDSRFMQNLKRLLMAE
jgi:inosine-uridine nucleoside N-ribohydrolase